MRALTGDIDREEVESVVYLPDMHIKHLMDYKKQAETGLQNYGRNIAKRVAKGQADRATTRGTSKNYSAINPFPNPLKKSSYK